MYKRIKTLIKNCPLTKPLLLCAIKVLNRFSQRKRKKLINLNSQATISALQRILSEAQVFFFFVMFSLLGAVREGRPLGHDLDIDLGVHVENDSDKSALQEHLLSNGCTLKCSYTVDGIGLVEQSYELNGIKFDVSYYKCTETADYCYLLYRDPGRDVFSTEMDVVELKCSHISETEHRLFDGVAVNVPKNPELYLAERYGEDWRIPNTNYIYWAGPSTTKIPNIGRYY